MAVWFGPIIFLISAALLEGTGAEVTELKAAHNTTVELKCIDPSIRNAHLPPAWFMNGSLLVTKDGYRTSRDKTTGQLIGTLIVNGNNTCGTFHVYCQLYNGPIVHNTTLTIEGQLPAPDDIHINESNNSLVIQWNPPYSASNSKSSFIHVDPHITQYTVYIIDNYTGNYVETVNVTGTTFRRKIFISNDDLCPIYHVTAWNSGGEGKMSLPQPGHLPRVPNSIAAENIDVLRETGVLVIQLHVTDSCTVRMPNSFLVTVMSTDGVTIKVKQQDHQQEHRDATIQIVLPHDRTVDECNLIVRISAGNSAGMSSPTEITVGCQVTGPSTVTTPTTTSTGSDSDTTSTQLADPQGDNNIIYIAVGCAVGAVLIVATGALLLILLWKCRRTTKVQPPKDEVGTKSLSDVSRNYKENTNVKSSAEENEYTESPLLRRTPVAVVITTDPLSSSTDINKPPTEPQAPEGNPQQLVYARVDPAKHSRPQPPANDNQVQYAQIQHQDQQ